MYFAGKHAHDLHLKLLVISEHIVSKCWGYIAHPQAVLPAIEYVLSIYVMYVMSKEFGSRWNKSNKILL